MVFSALASGGAVVASQYIGSGDREKGTQAASQLVIHIHDYGNFHQNFSPAHAAEQSGTSIVKRKKRKRKC